MNTNDSIGYAERPILDKSNVYPSRAKPVKNFIMDCGKNILSLLLSVTAFSSHTSGARDLKFGLHNPYMNASRVAKLIFDILPRS